MSTIQHCLRTFTEVKNLIINLKDENLIEYSGTNKSEDIRQIESMFDIFLPEDYCQFLESFGSLISSNICILGIGSTSLGQVSIIEALLALRLEYTEFPLELLPIEFIKENVIACLQCDLTERKKFSPLVQFNLDDPAPLTDLPQLAACFKDYIYDRLNSVDLNRLHTKDTNWDQSWENFEKHVIDYQNKFDYDHAKGGTLPRSTDYRPYRYCIQDVVFGVVVIRHNQEVNCLQVDVFLTANIPEYGPLAGANALTAFLLSEAFKCGGTMEIHFTRNVENGQVPAELKELASQYNIQLSLACQGKIKPEEAKALYLALSGFSSKLQEQLSVFEKGGKITIARACYVVHHGVWSKEQLEMIVLGSENPNSIISGQSSPVQRHLYNHDIMHARAALMAGMFERVILQRERSNEEGVGFDMEDDLRELDIEFDGDTYVKSYRCTEAIKLEWLYGVENSQSVSENMLFHVLVRPRDRSDLSLHFISDISYAKELKERKKEPVFILVPRDFTDRPQEWTSKVLAITNDAGIGILVCPEAVNTLDTDAAQRLSTSRILRQ